MDRTLVFTPPENAPTASSDRSLMLLWAMTALALVLHNAEELLLDLTGWIADRPHVPGHALHGDQAQYAIALTFVTAAVIGLAVVAVATQPRWSAEVLVCLAYALMANGMSHGLLSLLTWSAMPGVMSGVLLLALGALVVHALPAVTWTASSVLVTLVAAVGGTVGALALAAFVTNLT